MGRFQVMAQSLAVAGDRLVVSFGRLLPLEKPSPLGEKLIIQKLVALSSGLTGKVTILLTQAAELAIRGGAECISAELIDEGSG